MKILAVIPHYNHGTTVGAVVKAMQHMNIDSVIVDDGSDNVDTLMALEGLEAEGFNVVYRPLNGGKGAAVKTGIAYAKEHGYSHALQVDADAQHNLTDAKKLIAAAKKDPNAIICAQPMYGDDAPKSRLYGRKITNFWLMINTLSCDIKDGMCGFRIYPVEQTSRVLIKYSIGNRMDFDSDLLVRLHREHCVFVWIPTPVKYEVGGVSHFRVWQDNLLISGMHTRLFFDMLRQFPHLLKMRLQKNDQQK